MTKHYYFAYGSNTNIGQMAMRCPNAVNLGPAYLQDYKLVFRIHADIELCENHQVQGVLWEITDQHLVSLDRYEGFPKYYIRHRVFVSTPNGRVIAWVYVMHKQDQQIAPIDGYFENCKDGYRANNLDTKQLDEALETCNHML